jgi:frataxin
MDFNYLCETYLEELSDKIDQADKDFNLDIEYQDGILSIKILSNNKIFVINRNSGNKKIWYSSPFSGADYFSYDQNTKQWLSDSKVELTKKIFEELKEFF